MDNSWQRGRLVIDGNSIDFVEKGTSSSVVVFLHALPGSHLDYAAVLEPIAKLCRVIALDWPSFGAGEQTADVAKASPLYFSGLLKQFLLEMKIESPILIGNSIGGYAAVRVALDLPDQVRGIILINSGGFTQHSFFTRFFCRLKGSLRGTRWLTYPMAKLYLKRRTPVVCAMLERAKKIKSNPLQVEVEAAIWRSFLHPDSNLIQAAKKLRVPTLIVWGKHDLVVPWNRDGRNCQSSIPLAKTVLMNTGHCPPAEQPDDFVREARRFISSILNKKV
jgi:pimeloyl-ACP methyl ester carboxylesterase